MINKEELQLLENKNWEDITTNKDQMVRILHLNQISMAISNNDIYKEKYEEYKKYLSVLQKEINKYDEENIKPIKQLLLKLKDKVIGEYQKSTIDYVKQLKKDLENKAIELGYLEKVEKPIIQKVSDLDRFKTDLNNYIEEFCYVNNFGDEPYLMKNGLNNFIKEWK